jgi:hypothetical protein
MIKKTAIAACQTVLIHNDPYLSGCPSIVKWSGAGSGRGNAMKVIISPTRKAAAAGICVHKG